MNTFIPANILLPNVSSMEKWAVIACDQFVSQPEYWAQVRELVADAPSTLQLILPEAEPWSVIRLKLLGTAASGSPWETRVGCT